MCCRWITTLGQSPMSEPPKSLRELLRGTATGRFPRLQPSCSRWPARGACFLRGSFCTGQAQHLPAQPAAGVGAVSHLPLSAPKPTHAAQPSPFPRVPRAAAIAARPPRAAPARGGGEAAAWPCVRQVWWERRGAREGKQLWKHSQPFGGLCSKRRSVQPVAKELCSALHQGHAARHSAG